MFEKLEIVRMAQALAAHSGTRQSVVARNIANADTPGYHAQDLPEFRAVYRSDSPSSMKSTRPGHLSPREAGAETAPTIVNGAAAPNGNTVSLEGEMVKAAEIRQGHDMALSVYRASSDILRAALGRSR